MTIRHFATIAGLITLLIVATFDLARHDDPDPYMIVSDTSGDAFLYHEASGDVISVTADWEGVYVFSTGEIGSDKGLYTITPDGWLVMHYSTRMNSSNPSGLLLTALFKFNPSGTIVRPAMPGDPEAFLLTTTPDDEWMIFSQQGMFYRQRVGSEQVELITDPSPLAFKAWLSDNRTMIVSDLGPDSSLHLLDILTGNIQPVDLDSAFGSLTPSHKPDWFLLRESYDTGQAINYINFETNERIELLPPQNDTTYVTALDVSGESLVYMSFNDQKSRELWRVDQEKHINLLLEDVVFTEWSPDYTILLVFTETIQQQILWLIPTDTWQPTRVYQTSSRYLRFGHWLSDGFLFFDDNRVVFTSYDGTSCKTLYELPAQRLSTRGISPDNEWLIIHGQNINSKYWLFKIRLDGSHSERFLPEAFQASQFHGWLPAYSRGWHALQLLVLGGVLLLVGGRRLRRRW